MSHDLLVQMAYCPFVIVLRWNENGGPLFYLRFLLDMATKKYIYITEKNIWIVEVVFFLKWVTRIFLFWATPKNQIMLKLSISVHFFKIG